MNRPENTLRDALLADVRDVVTLVDDEGTITYVSPTVTRVAGYEQAELTGTSIFDLVHPEDRARVQTGFSGLVTGENRGKPVSYRLQAADGGSLWVETVGTPRDQTDLEGHLLTTRDLATDRQLYELLTEASPDLLYFKDTEHRLVHVGQSFADILGTAPDELIGQTTDELWPADLAADVKACENRVLQGERVVDRERQVTHADGSVHWYSVNKIPRYDERGEVVGFLSVDREITERIHKERELKRYRQAIEGSSDMLAASNRDHEYLFSNERYREFYGIPASETLKGRSNEAVVGTEDFEAVKPHLESVYEGEHVSFEMTRENAAGASRTLDVRFYPLRDDDGSIVGDVTALRDITERKRRERELRTKTERLDLAIEGANLGIWDWDMETDTVTRNDEWKQMLGYDPAAIGDEFDSWKEIVHPEDLDAHNEALRRHIEGDADLYTNDYRLKTAAGDWKWVRNIGKVMERGPDGTPLRSVGIHQDIDEQKRAERERKQSKRRLRNIIDLVPDPIFVKNQAGEYLLINEALSELFDRSKDEILGHTDQELGMRADRAKAFRAEDRSVIESGESTVIDERDVTTAEGDSLTLQTVLIPYEPVGEDDAGVLGYARNITERTNYEAQIEVQRDTLEILNQIVRHDIRNDLQVVVSYTELLLEHVDPEGEKLARTVLEAAQNAVDITQTARDVADVVLQSETELEPRSVETVLTTEIEQARGKYEDARIEAPESIPSVTVLGDGMMESLIRNLLQNAVLHNDEPEPLVTVLVEQTDDQVEIAVADNGPGIPDERKEAIFEKGEQGLDSEGTGLGLYLVKSLVDRYDGSLSVEDNDPKGSVFRVQFPRAKAD